MNLRVTALCTALCAPSFANAAPGDADDDGIGDGVDVCITVADPGQEDTDGDGVGDACAHPSAFVHPTAVFRGAYLAANAVVRAGAVVQDGAVIGRSTTLGVNSVVEADVVVGRAVSIGDGSTLRSGVSVGYGASVGEGVTVGANAVVGPWTVVGDGVVIGDRTVLTRAVVVDAGTVVGADGVLGPEVTVGADAMVGTAVRVRRGALLDAFSEVGDRARIGRDAHIGPSATVGADAVVRGEATVYEDLASDGYLARGETLGTPRKRIQLQDGTRTWSDGTVAASCLAYLQAEGPGETYTGDVGDGVYRLATTGAPFDATCDMTGGGWTLALRVADSGNTFTFLSQHWTQATTLNADSLDPLTDLDAKYPAFNQVVGTQIRGCLRNLSTGTYGCKSYDLPNARTLLDMFANTPVGSRENSRGYYFEESRAERFQWQTMWGRPAGESSTSNNYVDTGINMDDDLSNYRARVRFGLGLNNEGNIYTLNDGIGFGASAYYNTSASGLVESPWRVSAGAAIGSNLIRTRGQIWVR